MEKNIYYICHYCIKYYTQNKKDMNRHYRRLNKCDCNNNIDYEKCKILSTGKKFNFNFDIKNCNINDLLFIVNNNNLHNNEIYENYKENNNIQNNSNQIDLLNHNNIINLPNGSHKKNFKEMFFNYELNKYICYKCYSGFTSKRSLLKHLETKKCLFLQELNNSLNNNI